MKKVIVIGILVILIAALAGCTQEVRVLKGDIVSVTPVDGHAVSPYRGYRITFNKSVIPDRYVDTFDGGKGVEIYIYDDIMSPPPVASGVKLTIEWNRGIWELIDWEIVCTTTS